MCGGQSRPGVRALGRLVFYASINSVAMTETLKKRLGRPATGKGTQVVVRLQPPMLALVDEWVKAQAKPITRAEAIRQMLALVREQSKN